MCGGGACAGRAGRGCCGMPGATRIEHVPHTHRHQRSQQPEGRPAPGSRHLQLDKRCGRQPADHNAQAGPHVDERPHGRHAQPRKLLQAEPGGVEKDHGAGHAGGKPQQWPGGLQMHRHAQGEPSCGHEPVPHQPGPVYRSAAAQPLPQPGLEGAGQRAHQVAQVVGAGQQAGAGQIGGPLRQHHGQQRREGEAADAHGHPQGHQPRHGDGQR